MHCFPFGNARMTTYLDESGVFLSPLLSYRSAALWDWAYDASTKAQRASSSFDNLWSVAWTQLGQDLQSLKLQICNSFKSNMWVCRRSLRGLAQTLFSTLTVASVPHVGQKRIYLIACWILISAFEQEKSYDQPDSSVLNHCEAAPSVAERSLILST